MVAKYRVFGRDSRGGTAGSICVWLTAGAVPVRGPAAWANAPGASAKLSAETTKTALFKVTFFNNDVVLSLDVSLESLITRMVNNDTVQTCVSNDCAGRTSAAVLKLGTQD
jgi:hypothetical protein